MYTASKDNTVSNIKGAAQNLRSTIEDTADEAREDLREAANNAGRRVRNFINSAGDEITHARDRVTTQIRTNPVQSSMIALGVGFIIGALLRR